MVFGRIARRSAVERGTFNRLTRPVRIGGWSLVIFFAAISAISSTAADERSKPPSQPSKGPGGSDYAHGSVKKCGLLGEGARAFHLYEPADPAPATAPVILFLHGYLGVNPIVYGAWIEHLVRRCNIVVFPIYQDTLIGAERYSDDALAAVREAFQILSSESGHVRPDAEGHWALVGHSLGGPIAANLRRGGRSRKSAASTRAHGL